LMLRVAAEPVSRDASEHGALRQKWLADHPKAQLYIDFPDFIFVRLRPNAALLNGGFASAYRLAPADLM
ncbi:MAG: pyridoxamine 5-phosphate oxidase, partial [Gemmobacter sp.]